jgi:hypothetical protein
LAKWLASKPRRYRLTISAISCFSPNVLGIHSALMELSSQRDDARATLEAILSKAMDDGIVDDAVIAANLSQRQAFWKLRDEMSAAQKPEGGSIARHFRAFGRRSSKPTPR